MQNKHQPGFERVQQSISVGAFVDAAHRVAEQLNRGRDPARLAVNAVRAWRRVPTSTARDLPGAERVQVGQFAAGVGHVASVVQQAVETRPSKNERYALERLHRTARIDQAHTSITTKGSAGIDAKSLLEQTKTSKRDYPQGTVHEMHADLDELSIDAMLLHLQALETREISDPRIRAAKENLQRAGLGRLINQAVGAMQNLYTNRGAIAQAPGRMIETMYFTYQLMGWYRHSGSLADGYPRFALPREDSPMSVTVKGESPAFDVLVASVDKPARMVQVKTSARGRYAPGIEPWAPNKPDLMARADEVMGWFGTMVNNDRSDSDINAAWRNLTAYFGPRPTPQNK